jgi:hypothetical protein
MAVIARSVSDEAISAENKDCFAPLAMTFRLNFTALPIKGEERKRVSPRGGKLGRMLSLLPLRRGGAGK